MGIKVAVYQGEENGVLGIGVKVLDDQANLADLLAAWQPLCDDEDVYRIYGNCSSSPCKGCKINCCNTAYVIPDLIAFKNIAKQLNISYTEFIFNYFQADKYEKGLLRLEPEPCIFLADNICTIYDIRTLICRFYLCSNLLPSTEQFIYDITWTGVAATQLFALEEDLIGPISQNGLTSFDKLFVNLLAEYQDNLQVELFKKAKEYKDIPLKPFLKSL
ncbi:MAG: YkgJ family cysteine cluster protein [Syntrophomonadaceae bacterium]|nr:YkgJ family cysteine cluster protein [Syntrophomonadaceae bacterium]